MLTKTCGKLPYSELLQESGAFSPEDKADFCFTIKNLHEENA
jgi:hypothetical protein